MTRAASVLLVVVLVTLTLSGTKPATAAPDNDAATAVDRAASCLRRSRANCALGSSDKALALLSADAGSAGVSSLLREALVLRAQALALLDRPKEAASAFEDAMAKWPGWRPVDDTDPRIRTAWDKARQQRIVSRLPSRLTPGPAPLPPQPSTRDLVGPLTMYAPTTLVELDQAKAGRRRFSLSIGGGVGFPLGDAADRLDPGVHAAVDFSYILTGRLALWLEGVLALLSIDDTLPVESGYSRGLTLFSVAVGALYSVQFSADIELVLGLGLGYGAFGIRTATEASGLSIHGNVGVRYRADANLAFRLDVTPIGVASTAKDVGFGGHVAVIVRGETSF